MQIEYTARRSLIGGHTVDTIYTIDVELSRIDRSYKGVGKRNISLDGSTVTTIHRNDEMWDFTTTILDDSGVTTFALMEEFLDSCANGEAFRIDINGSLESAILDAFNNPYRRNRVGILDYFRYSFKVRML